MKTETHSYFLQKGNKFLTNDDKFEAPGFSHKDAQAFSSEEAALGKAAAMGLDPDKVEVIKSKVRVKPTN